MAFVACPLLHRGQDERFRIILPGKVTKKGRTLAVFFAFACSTSWALAIISRLTNIILKYAKDGTVREELEKTVS